MLLRSGQGDEGGDGEGENAHRVVTILRKNARQDLKMTDSVVGRACRHKTNQKAYTTPQPAPHTPGPGLDKAKFMRDSFTGTHKHMGKDAWVGGGVEWAGQGGSGSGAQQRGLARHTLAHTNQDFS